MIRQGWLDAADVFNELADKAKPDGMRVGYHNHSIEFNPLDGEKPWDTFFNRTKKEVAIQFDTGNATAEASQPTVNLKKHPGRVEPRWQSLQYQMDRKAQQQGLWRASCGRWQGFCRHR